MSKPYEKTDLDSTTLSNLCNYLSKNLSGSNLSNAISTVRGNFVDLSQEISKLNILSQMKKLLYEIQHLPAHNENVDTSISNSYNKEELNIGHIIDHDISYSITETENKNYETIVNIFEELRMMSGDNRPYVKRELNRALKEGIDINKMSQEESSEYILKLESKFISEKYEDLFKISSARRYEFFLNLRRKLEELDSEDITKNYLKILEQIKANKIDQVKKLVHKNLKNKAESLIYYFEEIQPAENNEENTKILEFQDITDLPFPEFIIESKKYDTKLDDLISKTSTYRDSVDTKFVLKNFLYHEDIVELCSQKAD